MFRIYGSEGNGGTGRSLQCSASKNPIEINGELYRKSNVCSVQGLSLL